MMTFENIKRLLDMSKSEFFKLRPNVQADYVQALFDFAFEHNRKRVIELNAEINYPTDWEAYEHLSRWIRANMQGKAAS